MVSKEDEMANGQLHCVLTCEREQHGPAHCGSASRAREPYRGMGSGMG